MHASNSAEHNDFFFYTIIQKTKLDPSPSEDGSPHQLLASKELDFMQNFTKKKGMGSQMKPALNLANNRAAQAEEGGRGRRRRK